MNERPLTQGFEFGGKNRYDVRAQDQYDIRVQDRNDLKKQKVNVRLEDQYDIRVQDRNDVLDRNEVRVQDRNEVRVQDRSDLKKQKVNIRLEDQYDIRVQDRNEVRVQDRVFNKKPIIYAPVRKPEIDVSFSKPKAFDRKQINPNSLVQKGNDNRFMLFFCFHIFYSILIICLIFRISTFPLHN
jgi:hypothetical protein